MTHTLANVGRRRRALRPERIALGDDVAVRNDLVALEEGVSERTLNRGDALGAPFLMVGGVKYMPLAAYKHPGEPHSAQEPTAPPGRRRPRSVRLLIKENPRRRFWPPARDVHNLGLDVQEYNCVCLSNTSSR